MGPVGTNSLTSQTYDSNLDDGSSACLVATQGVLLRDRAVRISDITDGTSSTYAVGELAWRESNWYTKGWGYGATQPDGDFGQPLGCLVQACQNIRYPLRQQPRTDGPDANNTSFGSDHPGGANFLMVDGSVTFVENNIEMGLYMSRASRNGGEVCLSE